MIRTNKYNKWAWVIGNPNIGEGTWIGAFTVIDGSGGLTIGKRCDISCGVQIYTHTTALRCVNNERFYKNGKIRRDTIERAPTSIGDHTFIGANAIITAGIKIGSHCIIGANSVVLHDIPDYCIYAGVPAKLIRKLKKVNGRWC